MCVHSTLLMVTTLAMMLLAGCVGEPQTFYVAEPIVVKPRVPIRSPTRSTPMATSRALSTDEKQRLFQGFQQQQRLKSQAVTNWEAVP